MAFQHAVVLAAGLHCLSTESERANLQGRVFAYFDVFDIDETSNLQGWVFVFFDAFSIETWTQSAEFDTEIKIRNVRRGDLLIR